MSDDKRPPEFHGWAIIELVDRSILAGWVDIGPAWAAAGLIRIDVVSPKVDVIGVGAGVVDRLNDTVTTQYYGCQAIQCITPTTEQAAKAIGRNCPSAVSRLEQRVRGMVGSREIGRIVEAKPFPREG